MAQVEAERQLTPIPGDSFHVSRRAARDASEGMVALRCGSSIRLSLPQGGFSFAAQQLFRQPLLPRSRHSRRTVLTPLFFQLLQTLNTVSQGLASPFLVLGMAAQRQ